MTTTSGQSARFPTFAVGCANKGFDGFEGLVGLGQGPISLTSQLGSAIESKFSYCLVDINSNTASSPLYFGAAAALKGGSGSIQSTPIVASDEYPTYYLVTVNGVTVAGSQLSNPRVTIAVSGNADQGESSEESEQTDSEYSEEEYSPEASSDELDVDLRELFPLNLVEEAVG